MVMGHASPTISRYSASVSLPLITAFRTISAVHKPCSYHFLIFSFMSALHQRIGHHGRVCRLCLYPVQLAGLGLGQRIAVSGQLLLASQHARPALVLPPQEAVMGV